MLYQLRSLQINPDGLCDTGSQALLKHCIHCCRVTYNDALAAISMGRSGLWPWKWLCMFMVLPVYFTFTRQFFHIAYSLFIYFFALLKMASPHSKLPLLWPVNFPASLRGTLKDQRSGVKLAGSTLFLLSKYRYLAPVYCMRVGGDILPFLICWSMICCNARKMCNVLSTHFLVSPSHNLLASNQHLPDGSTFVDALSKVALKRLHFVVLLHVITLCRSLFLLFYFPHVLHVHHCPEGVHTEPVIQLGLNLISLKGSII